MILSPKCNFEDRKVPIDEFRKIVDSEPGKTIVLCGAGISMIFPSCLPSGDQLRDDCVKAIISCNDLKYDLREVMKSRSYQALLPEVVFQDVATFSPGYLDRFISKKFQMVVPNRVHHELSKRFDHIFTTNFDLCLDQLSSHQIFHLHGSIKIPSSLQNRLFRLGNTATYEAYCFKESVFGKNLLVLGYSFRDSDISRLVEEAEPANILFLSYDNSVPLYLQRTKKNWIYAFGGVHELFHGSYGLHTNIEPRGDDIIIRKPSFACQVNILLYLCFRAGMSDKVFSIFLSNIPKLRGRLKFKAISTTINCLRLAGHFNQAIDYCKRYQNSPIVKKAENADIASAFVVNIGLCYMEQGGSNFLKAEALFRQGLHLTEIFARHNKYKVNLDSVIVGSTIWKARIYNNIGWFFALKGDHKIALHYYKKSLAIKRIFSEEIGIAQTLVNISTSAINLDNIDESIELLNQVFLIMSKTPDTYICRDALYGTLRSIGVFASCLAESHSIQFGLEIDKNTWEILYKAASNSLFNNRKLLRLLVLVEKFAILLGEINAYSIAN